MKDYSRELLGTNYEDVDQFLKEYGLDEDDYPFLLEETENVVKTQTDDEPDYFEGFIDQINEMESNVDSFTNGDYYQVFEELIQKAKNSAIMEDIWNLFKFASNDLLSMYLETPSFPVHPEFNELTDLTHRLSDLALNIANEDTKTVEKMGLGLVEHYRKQSLRFDSLLDENAKLKKILNDAYLLAKQMKEQIQKQSSLIAENREKIKMKDALIFQQAIELDRMKTLHAHF